ncbi:MAG TPA: hypothetical protein VE398_17735 [Acidobacteriota bacterium]|nr:hypothetical protein [Acidobacteriota bacterium]
MIISVTQDGILTEITDRDGKSVLVRDDWKIASYTPSAGKFAFEVRGRDEVWISNWIFEQKHLQ